MLHDFEEIILIMPWKKRHNLSIKSEKSPEKAGFLATKIPYNDIVSTASSSIGVYIEFAILSVVALLTCMFKLYYIWFLFMFFVTLHYLIHFKMCITFRGYVPGVTTSAIFFPISILIILGVNIIAKYTIIELVLLLVGGAIIGIILVKVLHISMGKFDNILQKYANNKNV
jgi:hypothetical protein